ncbi:MAG: hypothetical protein Q4Q14_07270 [Methanobrevibacter sp.]|nr:hypothetical protein [Methanobrevibacter sp.]
MFFNPLIIDLSASKNLKKDLVYTILYSNNLKLEYDEENCIIKVCEKEVDENEKKIQEKKKQKFEGFFKRKKWGRPNTGHAKIQFNFDGDRKRYIDLDLNINKKDSLDTSINKILDKMHNELVNVLEKEDEEGLVKALF